MSYVNKDCDVAMLAILRERAEGRRVLAVGRGDTRRERRGFTVIKGSHLGL